MIAMKHEKGLQQWQRDQKFWEVVKGVISGLKVCGAAGQSIFHTLTTHHFKCSHIIYSTAGQW